MATQAMTFPTMISVLWNTENTWLRNSVMAIVGSLVLWASARIQVPFYPVPMTMQTLVVLVIAMSFGARLGLATVLLYGLEGALGLPVFAGTPEKGIGLAYMMGPTGGYLLGFALAAFTVGWLAERAWDRSMVRTLFAMIVGVALIMVPGVLWLGMWIGWDQPVLQLGLLPFLPGEAVKIVLATFLLPLSWHQINQSHR